MSTDTKHTLYLSLSAGHWSLLNMLMQRGLVFGTFLVTARFLSPADFGVIAIAAITPALIDGLTSVSFEASLVQKPEGEERPYLDAAWTFGVLRAVLIFAVVWACAPFAASYFHSEVGTLVFRLSGLTVLFQGLVNVGQIYFFREIQFRKVFLRDLAFHLTATTLSILGAILFRSYWALFGATAIATLASSLATYRLSSYRPSFDFHLRKLLPLVNYTKWMFGQGMVNQISRTLEDTLVARYSPAAAVGLFTKAKGLANAPTAPLVSLINKISFSAYSRVQESLDHVRGGFYRSFDMLFVVALPYLVAISIAGHRIVSILLGDAWVGITGVLTVLTFAATIDILTTTLSIPIMNALGVPRSQFFVSSLYTITLLTSLIVLVPANGTSGAAMAMLVSSIITGIAAFATLRRLIDFRFRRLLATIIPVGIATLIPVGIAVSALEYPFFNQTSGFILLGALCISLYGLVLILADRLFQVGPWNTFTVIFSSFRGRLVDLKHKLRPNTE